MEEKGKCKHFDGTGCVLYGFCEGFDTCDDYEETEDIKK